MKRDLIHCDETRVQALHPVLASAGISYQPILGCFSDIEREYDKVHLIGIPAGEMELI